MSSPAAVSVGRKESIRFKAYIGYPESENVSYGIPFVLLFSEDAPPYSLTIVASIHDRMDTESVIVESISVLEGDGQELLPESNWELSDAHVFESDLEDIEYHSRTFSSVIREASSCIVQVTGAVADSSGSSTPFEVHLFVPFEYEEQIGIGWFSVLYSDEW